MIDEAFVQDYFPQYNKYFLDESNEYSTEVMEDEIAMAEAEFLEYVDCAANTITNSLKRHLLNIVKYRGFVRVHGNTEFAEKPQIVKDYEATIAKLQAYKDGTEGMSGTAVDDDSTSFRITAKTRRFDTWFNDEDTQSDSEA